VVQFVSHPTKGNREVEGYIYIPVFLSLRAVPMGCPFVFPNIKKSFYPPPLNFQNIVLVFRVTSGVFVHYFFGEIINGILEAKSIRGWFKSNCPLLFILTFQTD